MIISFKRKTAIIALATVLLIVALSVTAAVVSSAADNGNGIVIVIDAGHGGIDGGVTGVKTSTRESDVNLAISKALADYFENAGYTAVLTRSDSGAVCEGSYKKLKDMEARKAVILDAKPGLVISVHCNSYPLQSVKGAQVFYDANSVQGKAYAEALQTRINGTLNEKSREAKTGDYYILRCSPYTSVLVECGFMSNPQDEAKLITSDYQKQVAFTIYSGVQALLEENQAVNQ